MALRIREEKEKRQRIIKNLQEESKKTGAQLIRATKGLLIKDIVFGEEVINANKETRINISNFKSIKVQVNKSENYRISLVKQTETGNDDIFHINSKGNGNHWFKYNTCINGVWGKEEVITYGHINISNGVIFDLTTEGNNINVSINGKSIRSFTMAKIPNILLAKQGDKITVN